MDLRDDLTVALAAFGLEATVTRPVPDDLPVATTVIWLPPVRRRRSDEVYEYGVELEHRQAERAVLSVPKADLTTCPLGTLIVAPPALGLPEQVWRVEEHEREHHDEWRVVVVPVADEGS
jgi:hypothetical protein